MDKPDTKTETEAERTPVVHVLQVEGAPPKRLTKRGLSEGSRKTQFQRGNRANPHGRRGKPAKTLSKERLDDLEAMWHVDQNQESEDTTFQHALYRQWMKMDPCGFMKAVFFLKMREPKKRPRR
jgi:hypothetical protein